MHPHHISKMIDASPMNRGMLGSDWLADPRNVAVVDGAAAMLFGYESPGTYQFHWLNTPGGRDVIDKTRRAFGQIFDKYNATIIFGLVSSARRDVRLMARWIGARCVGETLTEDGPCQIFVMTADMHKGLAE